MRMTSIYARPTPVLLINLVNLYGTVHKIGRALLHQGGTWIPKLLCLLITQTWLHPNAVSPFPFLPFQVIRSR